jgi:DNA-binding NtrC family response regulator
MKRLSILIAHEIPETCVRLSGWLRAHHTASVHSARDAMSASRLLHFDVVVNAMDLSQRSHLAAIQGIKRHQPWLRLLTIMGESYEASRPARSAYAMHQGANAVLFHPFSERQLLLALRACWNDSVVPVRCDPRRLLSKDPQVSQLPQTPEHFP